MESKQDLIKQRVKIDVINNEYESYLDKEVVVCGWISTARWQKKRIFVKLSDSAKSKLSPLQILFQTKDSDITNGLDTAEYDVLSKAVRGMSLVIKGLVVKSPAPGQKIELIGRQYYVLGYIDDPSGYPLDKDNLTCTALRNLDHLECHTSLKGSIYTIRSSLMTATEQFFAKEGYQKVDMPLITFSECEGGCQPMQATLLLTSGKITDIPTVKGKPDVDFSKDFFGAKASLTVSAQLELETQLPLGDVWTVTRAIRGEPSATSRHLCEFSMIEIEKAFSESANDIMEISERYIKYCIKHVLDNNKLELEFLDKTFGKTTMANLIKYMDLPFVRLTHVDAVKLLQEQRDKFVFPPLFTDDLKSEHEQWLVNEKFKQPIFITRYPKNVKAFYMPVIAETLEESCGVEHVDNFDILVPEVGELVGGSQRIHDITELCARITELGLDMKPLESYVDLRRKGSIPHGGMGLGFERLVKFVIGADGVKDCVAFPKFIGCGK